MITIKELAKELGVSPTTVSNVINGKTRKMSPETRKRIEMALVNHHYISEGRRENPKEIRLIAVDFCLGEKKNVLTDPFCGMLMEAVIENLRGCGRYVVSDSPSDEETILKKLETRNVEGAIVLGYDPEKCEELTRRAAKPIVFIDSGDGNYDSIGLQDREGAGQMTEYLIGQGHRRIAFFTDYKENSICNQMRLAGYREALLRRQLPFYPEDVYALPLDGHLRREILRTFAAEKAGRVCTAAFFVNDLFANEAVGLLTGLGVRVPEDLSVAGFDDNIYARLSNPMLTTVRQHPEEKAYEAVKLLMKRLRGEPVPVRSVHLPTELIVRDSVQNVFRGQETNSRFCTKPVV